MYIGPERNISQLSINTPFFFNGLLTFPVGTDGNELACNAGDPSLIPGLGRPPRERNGNPTSVFLPGKSHGQRSLADYSQWGRKELDPISTYKSGLHPELLFIDAAR